MRPRYPFDLSAGKYEEHRDSPGAEIKLVCLFAVLFAERPIYLMARGSRGRRRQIDCCPRSVRILRESAAAIN